MSQFNFDEFMEKGKEEDKKEEISAMSWSMPIILLPRLATALPFL